MLFAEKHFPYRYNSNMFFVYIQAYCLVHYKSYK